MRNRTRHAAATPLGLAVLLAHGAVAQTAPGAQDRGGLDEIVVTATKREQNLQEVPLSISAIGAEELRRIGADTYRDYLQTVPGVYYNDRGLARSSIVIRGVATSNGFTDNLQSSTAQYIDDFPTVNRFVGRATTDFRSFDVERVEVLRGPQGTLFGAGALGGAIRMITKKPDLNAFQARAEAAFNTVADGDPGYGVNGMVNVPLADGRAALRVAGYYRDVGGYVDNTWRGQENVDSATSTGGRAMVALQPTDDLSVRLGFIYQKDDIDDQPQSLPASALTFNGILPISTNSRATVTNLTVDYDFGPATLTSLTSFGTVKTRVGCDVARLLQSWFQADPNSITCYFQPDAKTLIQEVRLTSAKAGRLDWIVGGFWFRQKNDITQQFFSPTTMYNDALIESTFLDRALFGEVNFHATDTLTLTAGARVFREKFEFEQPIMSGPFAVRTGTKTVPLTTTEADSVTPKFAAAWQVRPDVNLYAQAAQGYRSGQVNYGASVDPISGERPPRTFEPDELWNYEVGAKTRWADGRIQANVGVFYIDWTNIQLNRFTPSGIGYIDNAGDATSKGGELELTALPLDWLQFGTSISYTDARLQSVKPSFPYKPGDELPGTPKFTAFTYAQLSTDRLFGGRYTYLRFEHRHASDQQGTLINNAALASDPYDVFNVRAGLEFERVQITLAVDNVTNEDALLVRNAPSLAYPQGSGSRLYPRKIGLTVGVDF
jgi:outer membrane receptor protein involved in Fe transport